MKLLLSTLKEFINISDIDIMHYLTRTGVEVEEDNNKPILDITVPYDQSILSSLYGIADRLAIYFNLTLLIPNELLSDINIHRVVTDTNYNTSDERDKYIYYFNYVFGISIYPTTGDNCFSFSFHSYIFYINYEKYINSFGADQFNNLIFYLDKYVKISNKKLIDQDKEIYIDGNITSFNKYLNIHLKDTGHFLTLFNKTLLRLDIKTQIIDSLNLRFHIPTVLKNIDDINSLIEELLFHNEDLYRTLITHNSIKSNKYNISNNIDPVIEKICKLRELLLVRDFTEVLTSPLIDDCKDNSIQLKNSKRRLRSDMISSALNVINTNIWSHKDLSIFDIGSIYVKDKDIYTNLDSLLLIYTERDRCTISDILNLIYNILNEEYTLTYLKSLYKKHIGIYDVYCINHKHLGIADTIIHRYPEYRFNGKILKDLYIASIPIINKNNKEFKVWYDTSKKINHSIVRLKFNKFNKTYKDIKLSILNDVNIYNCILKDIYKLNNHDISITVEIFYNSDIDINNLLNELNI